MPKNKRSVINSASEIPQHFESEDEEREWWASHDLSEAFYDEASEGLDLANLELSVMRLQAKVDQLANENKTLLRRLEKLEATRSSKKS